MDRPGSRNIFVKSEGWGKVIFSLCVSVHTEGGGGTYLGWVGEGYLPWMGGGGVPTLDRWGRWIGEGVPTLDREGVPTLDRGRRYLPWMGEGTYLDWGRGNYLG